jgi:hypothetical protein
MVEICIYQQVNYKILVDGDQWIVKILDGHVKDDFIWNRMEEFSPYNRFYSILELTFSATLFW